MDYSSECNPNSYSPFSEFNLRVYVCKQEWTTASNSFLLEDVEALENIERRSVFIAEHRNNDLDELDEVDFHQRYRFYKGTIEMLVELLRGKLNSAAGRNHAMTAAEKVSAAVRSFAFSNRQVNVGDLHSINQSSASRAITDVARAFTE
ncbi:hypothetical protein TNCT_368661 [Trichonephila clavata]|uniref:Nuclease HARBI1 n=1 Tax=Trichonephila clavata TaxID=2740835 RepID=A0A8X6KSD1_TRICU|nr:hypothetical protein TNCT_368661 [Trichonephila clavata]